MISDSLQRIFLTECITHYVWIQRLQVFLHVFSVGSNKNTYVWLITQYKAVIEAFRRCVFCCGWAYGEDNSYIDGLWVNYGTSNTIGLEIP